MFLKRYRLAPEFPFPVPAEDCITATRYFLRHSKKYRADPKRIGVMGKLRKQFCLTVFFHFMAHVSYLWSPCYPLTTLPTSTLFDNVGKFLYFAIQP